MFSFINVTYHLVQLRESATSLNQFIPPVRIRVNELAGNLVFASIGNICFLFILNRSKHNPK